MKMKDQLSALIDGEFDVENSEHLITSAKTGGELKSCWAHYHLIGDSMRGETHMSHDFSHRVMSALESEPTVLLPNLDTGLQANKHAASRASSKPPFVRKSTQFWSVAASAAAVMFVGVMVLQQQINQPTQQTAVQIAQQEITKEQAAKQAVSEQLSPVEIAQSVPTEYLQAHQAAAPSAGAYYIQTASYAEPQQ
jgi:sigma-E factor negative regulatory protein RseA